MPIKYADITIVINTEKQSWGSYFKYWLEDEDITTENDTIVILFEDGTIVDDHENKQWEIGPIIHRGVYPVYFKKPEDRLVILKTPHIKNGNLALDFKPIFKDNLKFTVFNKEASAYNAVYEIADVGEVFALVKSGPKCQYVLAYDDEYFDKSDISYFIHKVFTRQ